MTVTATDIQDNMLNEWLPPSAKETFSDWITDKGKYFCEAVANAAHQLSLFPTLGGTKDPVSGVWTAFPESAAWSSVQVGMKNCKNFLAFPSVIKGSMSLYANLRKGGVLARNLIGEACYIIGDSIETLQGYTALAGTKIPETIRILGFDILCKAPLERVKDVTGIFGLSNTSYNLTLDIEKLRQIDLTKGVHKDIKDVKKALELKKHIVEAEIDNKWYDRLRCMSSVALCTLGLTGTIVGAALCPHFVFSSWLFAALGSVSVYGKYNMYASKAQGEFFQRRYAELLTVKTQSSQPQVKPAKPAHA